MWSAAWLGFCVGAAFMALVIDAILYLKFGAVGYRPWWFLFRKGGE